MPGKKICHPSDVFKHLYEKKILLEKHGIWSKTNLEINLIAEKYSLWRQRSGTVSERNNSRNFYPNPNIYDAKRVKITKSRTNKDGYVDASFISIPKIDRKYILAGDSHPDYIPHFWQMVVEQKVPAIVKLTPVPKPSDEDFVMYYPIESPHRMNFGKYEVLCKKTNKYYSYDLRILSVETLFGKDRGRIHIVHHYTLTNWHEEKVVPVNSLMELHKHLILDKVLSQKPPRRGPLSYIKRSKHSAPSYAPIIQCEYGHVRTAAFILIDAVKRMLEVKMKSYYSLEMMLVRLKKQNNNIRIPFEVMKGVYDCILEYLIKQNRDFELLKDSLEEHADIVSARDPNAENVKKYIKPHKWIIDNKERDMFIAKSDECQIETLQQSSLTNLRLENM